MCQEFNWTNADERGFVQHDLLSVLRAHFPCALQILNARYFPLSRRVILAPAFAPQRACLYEFLLLVETPCLRNSILVHGG